MNKLALATALAAVVAAPAFAQSEGNTSGLYLGAGVGRFNVEIDNAEELAQTVQSFDSDDTSWKVFGGWRFLPWLAVELDYIDLGKPEDTLGSGVKISTEVNGFAPYVVGTLPLGPIELFARAGYYFYDIKVNAQSIKTVDESDEDFVYGGGVGITLFEHLNARLEYEVIDASQVKDANALWLSGAWRF